MSFYAFNRVSNEAWKLITKINAYNISSNPHSINATLDSLANVASCFVPLKDGFSIELISGLFVPNSITSWMVFNEDEYITNVLINNDAVIDHEEHEKPLQNCMESMELIKGNLVPRGVLTLDKHFDIYNIFRKLVNVKTNNSCMNYELINQGTKEDPKKFNVGTYC